MNVNTPIEKREFKIVGKSVKRDDVLEKVTGEAEYTGDVKLAGMLHGKMKRATIAHARIKSIDVSKALAATGSLSQAQLAIIVDRAGI